MRSLSRLFDNNRAWSERIRKHDPAFFRELSQQQSPEYLWIGCADSRVPANEIVVLLPGELFVHRNVANVVVHTDLNCLSVIQFAVEFLKVRHVIVCGHYGCSGVRAALGRDRLGLVENWLRHVQDVRNKYPDILSVLADTAAQADRLCELNVIEQVVNVCQSTVVQDAWSRGQPLSVHGWIYGRHDGRIRELGFGVDSPDDLAPASTAAWIVWKEAGRFSNARGALSLHLLQLALNALWSWLFFGMRRPGLAAVEIIVLWIAIAATLLAFARRSRLAAALLVPYLLWVTFAAALNLAIWARN